MRDTTIQTDRRRPTTPEPHSREGSTKNTPVPRHSQESHLPRWLPDSVAAARVKLPILVGLLLTCSPTIFLYSLESCRDHQQRTDLSILIRTYILTGTVGMTVAMLVQSVLAYLLALLCFNGHANATLYLAETMKAEHDIKDEAHRKRRREMSRRHAYWVFMLLFSFVVAGLVEEWIKYIIITAMVGLAQRSSHGRGSIKTERDYVAVAVSAALGFATVENIAFLYAAARRRKVSSGDDDTTLKEGREDAMFTLLTAVERVALGIPGHAMTAALIGVNLLIRDHRHLEHAATNSMSAWLILRDSALFHGCFNFVLFAASALEGNVGWVHPWRVRTVCLVLALAVGLQATLALVLRTRLRQVGMW
ncbi:hypothetical protein CLAIMM_14531 [Cladophialophora immunda]|nr:hypothetical protein CLAIMM_14531 [Cladophialophora immunda]